MSAFIISKKTMDQIISTLIDRAKKTASNLQIEDPEDFGILLYQMNTRAVNSRYNERSKTPEYHYNYVRTSPVQGYKSLSCLLYQCSEGSVPKTKLFKQMTEISRDMAECIVSELPEYDSAGWD